MFTIFYSSTSATNQDQFSPPKEINISLKTVRYDEVAASQKKKKKKDIFLILLVYF